MHGFLVKELIYRINLPAYYFSFNFISSDTVILENDGYKIEYLQKIVLSTVL